MDAPSTSQDWTVPKKREEGSVEEPLSTHEPPLTKAAKRRARRAASEAEEGTKFRNEHAGETYAFLDQKRIKEGELRLHSVEKRSKRMAKLHGKIEALKEEKKEARQLGRKDRVKEILVEIDLVLKQKKEQEEIRERLREQAFQLIETGLRGLHPNKSADEIEAKLNRYRRQRRNM